ncbi:MAG TPA: HutD family protein [Bacteroidia bacterium]
MKFHFYPFSKQPISNWSGGSTRQLAIYPPGAELAKRNFVFRFSTATVEIESSVFTKFENYRRCLMILEGELKITHNNDPSETLKPFHAHYFDGAWDTKAEGKVIDFNVIFSKKQAIDKVVVTNEQMELGAGKTFSTKPGNFIGIYVRSGKLEIGDALLSLNDFILMEWEQGDQDLKIRAGENATFILTEVMKQG